MQSTKRARTDSVDLLSTLDKLRSFILSNTFEAGALPDQILECIPTVIVLGDQSSGKSSLLSAIAKYDLPVGTGRTTASRIELRFRQSPNKKSTIMLEKNDGSVHSVQDIQENSISMAHDALIAYALENSENEFFTNGAIVLNIEGPEEKNMTLVDLPGLIVPVDEISQQRSEAILTMINQYTNKPNCLIIHVLDVSKDIDTTISRAKLTQTRGIPTSRVINVFTKFDILNEAYHTTKLNELHTKVPQGIFVQCRDAEGKSVSDENFPHRDPRFTYGREHFLTKVEKFTQDYLQTKHGQLLNLLKSFQTSINDILRQIGHRQKQGYEIYRTYSDALFNQLRTVKENDKPFAQLVNRVHGVAPLAIAVPLVDEQIQNQLISERGLRLCSPVETIIRSYIQRGIQSIQTEVFTWEADFTRALKDDIQTCINLEGYPAACKLINNHVEYEITEFLNGTLKSFTEEIQTYLTESYTSPTLFNRQEFDSYVSQSTSSLSTLRKVIQDLHNRIPSEHIVAYVQREIQNIENRVGEVDMIKSQIQAYWKSRMSVLQNNLHNKLSTIRNKLFDHLQESIRNFDNVEQLDEDLNDAQLREKYLQADVLVNECLSAMR